MGEQLLNLSKKAISQPNNTEGFDLSSKVNQFFQTSNNQNVPNNAVTVFENKIKELNNELVIRD